MYIFFVHFFQSALDIRQSIFGPDNLLTAGSHEDLAYALYVRDYSTGNFDKARLVINSSFIFPCLG